MENNVENRKSKSYTDKTQVFTLERLKIILSKMPCGAGIFSLKTGGSVFLNSAYYTLTGYTPEEYKTLISNKGQKLFFSEDQVIHEQIQQQFFEEGSLNSMQYRILRKDGGVCRLKLSVSSIIVDGESCALCFYEDITSVHEEEEQQRILQEALDEAKAAYNAKSEFLSRMSHDLRTPMNVIIGLTLLALDKKDITPDMKETLVSISDSSRYLLTLINDCLDMEKINSGKIELHPAPYSYMVFFNNIKAVIEPLCRKKNITLVMDDKHTIKTVIIADQMRLDQIFYNLLSNAVKFTPDGGKVEMLTRTVSCENGYVTNDCIVRDNGIGMSEDFQTHMFEPFAQESDNPSPEYQGSGLGLPIVKQLVDLMGASITVKSKQGEGTEFKIRFHFPIKQSISMEEKEKKHVSTEQLRGKRILLVEDHPLNMTIAVKFLEKAGIIPVSAVNGKEALDMFRSSPENYYDAVLMDIRMPVMNGLNASRAIRSLDRSDAKTIPIIAMTANAFDTDVKESINAGMNAHLVKPIEPDKLFMTLSELL